MSKDSSAKYYQNNKERPQKKLVKDIVHKRKKVKGLSKEYKEKTDNMVVNDTKIYHKIKNKSLLSIEENIIR